MIVSYSLNGWSAPYEGLFVVSIQKPEFLGTFEKPPQFRTFDRPNSGRRSGHLVPAHDSFNILGLPKFYCCYLLFSPERSSVVRNPQKQQLWSQMRFQGNSSKKSRSSESGACSNDLRNELSRRCLKFRQIKEIP